MAEEHGSSVYRTGKPLPPHIVNGAIRLSAKIVARQSSVSTDSVW
jgi:hypothetical protein